MAIMASPPILFSHRLRREEGILRCRYLPTIVEATPGPASPSTFTNSYLDSTKEIDRQTLSVGKFCMHRLHRTSSADEAHTQCCPVSTPIVINHLSNAAGAASKIVLLTYFVMRVFVILVLPFLSVTASAAEFNVGLSYG